MLSGMNPIRRTKELEQFGVTEPRTAALLLTNALFNQAESPECIWMEQFPEGVK